MGQVLSRQPLIQLLSEGFKLTAGTKEAIRWAARLTALLKKEKIDHMVFPSSSDTAEKVRSIMNTGLLPREPLSFPEPEIDSPGTLQPQLQPERVARESAERNQQDNLTPQQKQELLLRAP